MSDQEFTTFYETLKCRANIRPTDSPKQPKMGFGKLILKQICSTSAAAVGLHREIRRTRPGCYGLRHHAKANASRQPLFKATLNGYRYGSSFDVVTVFHPGACPAVERRAE
jgi:hypothetical protein